MFDNSDKERVRESLDIVEVINRTVSLNQRGRDYVGLCPWHEDSRPSLTVNKARQTWRCWVCDKGGDIFSYVMEREGIGFAEALEQLADLAGIQLTRSKQPRAEAGSVDDPRFQRKAMQWVEQQMHQFLTQSPDAKVARDYLENRKINQDSIARFNIGFAPDSWQWLTDLAKGTLYPPELLERIGVIKKSEKGRYYDIFRGRVMFPIHDNAGRCIALGGRILPEFTTEQTPKYVNSPESLLFKKSKELYGLDLAMDSIRKDRRVFIMEGYTDVIMANQQGVTNALAVLGTAVGEQHLKRLKGIADQVVLVLDGDEAGQRRTSEVLDLFIRGQVDLQILPLPRDTDPCDFLLNKGADAFRGLMQQAMDALDFRIEMETTGINLLVETHKANTALENILQTLSQIPKSDNAANLRLRQVFPRIARRFGITIDDVRNRLGQLRKTQAPTTHIEPNVPTPEMPQRKPNLNVREQELIEILVLNPELTDSAVNGISIDRLPSEHARLIIQTYHDRLNSGASTEFADVLLEIEDRILKSLLVNAIENATNKAASVRESAEERLNELIDAYANDLKEGQMRQNLEQLVNQNLAEDDEMEILKQILDDERRRHGISSPTDG